MPLLGFKIRPERSALWECTQERPEWDLITKATSGGGRVDTAQRIWFHINCFTMNLKILFSTKYPCVDLIVAAMTHSINISP